MFADWIRTPGDKNGQTRGQKVTRIRGVKPRAAETVQDHEAMRVSDVTATPYPTASCMIPMCWSGSS